MRFSSSLITLLATASVAVCSTLPVSHVSLCPPSDRVVVRSSNVTTSDGHEIQIATKACSADVIKVPRRLRKRQVINVSGDGTLALCVTGEGVGPVAADCQIILDYLQTNFVDIDSQATFTVAPGFAEVLTAGTCEWAWINTEPSTGFTLEEGFLDLFVVGHQLQSCILDGDSGGIVTPTFTASQFTVDWQFEEFHS